MTEQRTFPPDYTPPPGLDKFGVRAFITGLAALALAGVVAFATADLRGFLFSYLAAYVFWTGVTVGCLALVMLQYVARGAWGVAIRRVGESGMRTLPLMAVLFIPILAGMRRLFPWSRAEAAADEALRIKRAYLNAPGFAARGAAYFVIWALLVYFIYRWSGEQDRTGDPRLTDRARSLSGPGIVIFGLTVTFAATDWVMSLDPYWASSIFGILFMGGWGLSALTFMILALAALARFEPMRSVLTPQHFHDLGTLMFAMVMLYTYFAFSQFLIIWSGNLPEEIPWYLRRMTGGWQFVGIALLAFHFAVPFLLLLLRRVKRNARALGAIAAAMLLMRMVDTFYLVAPEAARSRAHYAGHFPGLAETLLYAVLPVGIGGVWLAFFVRELRKRPLMPLRDPLLARALRHGREAHV
jgi:hypothetical protein